jgi:DNA-binding transcriptional ArsR family regulator
LTEPRFSDAERLELFRLLDRIYQSERRLGGGDVIDVLILRTIAMAKMEGRPMDVSSLAGYLGLSRQTVGRRVQALIRRGAVVREKSGKRGLLFTSDRARASSLDYVDHAIAEAIAFVRTLGNEGSK